MAMAPGWYQDPFSSAGYVRWWDGERWGASTSLPEGMAPAAPGAPVPLPPPSATVPTSASSSRSAPPAAYSDPAYPPPAYGSVQAPPLASWGLRAVARIVDTLLESVVLAPITWSLLGPAWTRYVDSMPTDGSIDQQAVQTLLDDVAAVSLQLTVAVLIVTFLYEVPQNRTWGRTVGKRLVGLRIRPLAADGGLTWLQAVLRWAAYAVGAAVLGSVWTIVDYLWPLWDKPWRQALHDKAAKTIVVPQDRR